MKSAEEWIDDLDSSAEITLVTKSQLQAIQMDAWKQGMTDAADHVREHAGASEMLEFIRDDRLYL